MSAPDAHVRAGATVEVVTASAAVRTANGGVPWWHIVLSVALIVVTVYGMVQLAGRIYAGVVLRIGRRVRLKETWRGGEV